jgi:Ser/Thr protein kinase RdoA (MazF antagonist)
MLPGNACWMADFVHPEVEGAWVAASATAMAEVDAAFERHGSLHTMRLHGDCHSGNVLWRDEGAGAGPHFVDLDDACTGPAIQDLWMLLSGDEAAMRAQLEHVLAGYRVFMPFDERELALVEPLRTLRMICHSAWIAERWSDPAFPIAFPWFASPSYWQQQAIELNEQVERMQGAW